MLAGYLSVSTESHIREMTSGRHSSIYPSDAVGRNASEIRGRKSWGVGPRYPLNMIQISFKKGRNFGAIMMFLRPKSA